MLRNAKPSWELIAITNCTTDYITHTKYGWCEYKI